MAKHDLHNVLFSKQRIILTQFGEDLLLAMKRRCFTKKLLCERTGFDHKSLNKVFAGDPGVAIGTYLKVLPFLAWKATLQKWPLMMKLVSSCKLASKNRSLNGFIQCN